MNQPLHQSSAAPTTPTAKLPKRSEIDGRYKWNLADIYESAESWERQFATIPDMIEKVRGFAGTLADSPVQLLECLRSCDDLGETFDKLFVYAHLLRDEESGDAAAQALADRVVMLRSDVSQAVSFLSPEILALPEGLVEKFLADNDDLKLYAHSLDNTLRRRDHTLSEPEEKLLAMAANMASGPQRIFNMLNNADIKFPSIRDADGDMVEVTKGRYAQFMESTDRRVRKDAYNALLGTYSNYSNTLAASLSANVGRDIFYARARKYESCLAASLDRYNIPANVYDTVVDVIGRNLEPLHRYGALRKRILGLDALKPYDMFVPLFPEVDEKLSYEEAVEEVVAGLAPMGPEYVSLLEKGFRSGWVDVFESEGKRAGAYSWGAYGTHPYVLLNYQGRLNDVFTIAHELGHSLHTWFTTKTQPYVYGDYSIFTAEVASTTNESILMDYFLKKTDDKQKKLYLLNHYLDQIRSTVYTQVLFAEFERIIHERVEGGHALTADAMGTIFRELYRKYNGAEVEDDDATMIYWARIPHFYNSFYVYQYATGYSAATMLSQKILAGEEGALDRYIEFLKGGSSLYPIDILRRAGVDMATPEPIEATAALFAKLLDEMESLLD